MNWNLMKFLPEAGACQTNFNVSRTLFQLNDEITNSGSIVKDYLPNFLSFLQMIVAGYILAVFQYQTDEQQRLTPGNTPVRRRGGSQMSQV